MVDDWSPESAAQWLNKRQKPPAADPSLAYRIIDSAKTQTKAAAQKTQAGLLDALSDMLLLPRPQLAFAMMLVLGLALGLSVGSVEFLADTETVSPAQDLSDVFRVNDSFNTEEFL